MPCAPASAAVPASHLSDILLTLVQLDQLGSGWFSAGLTRRKVLIKSTRFLIVRFPPTTNIASWQNRREHDVSTESPGWLLAGADQHGNEGANEGYIHVGLLVRFNKKHY